MHNAHNLTATLVWVTKKRSRNPVLVAFGAWLEAGRGKASREQISIKLTALGVPLGGSTIAQYEKGTVWSPDPGVLWGLSKIYGYPLEQAIELLKTNRANPDLLLSDLLTIVGGESTAPSVHSPLVTDTAAAAIDGQDRAVSSDAATIRAAIGEARELASELRAAIAQVAAGPIVGRQNAAARAAAAKKLKNLRRRGR